MAPAVSIRWPVRGAAMALVFDDRKLLPPGVHDASLKDVQEYFARFQKTDRRIKLFAKLRDYVAALTRASCGTSVIINGSFVMACVDEPSDIDLIVVLPRDWDTQADLKPYQYNLVSARRVRKEYGFDIFVVQAGAADEQGWTEFFLNVNVKWCSQFGWPKESTKGTVRVTL